MVTRYYKKFREAVPFLEPLALAALLLFIFLINAFAEVAEEVMEGDTKSLDTHILMLMRNGTDPSLPWGPPWFHEVMRDISGMGGITILSFVSISAAIYLLMRNKKGQALYLLATVTIGTLLSNALKYGFGRERPDLFEHGSYTFTHSFPSGHSMMAAIVYLSIGMLLARSEENMRVKLYLIGLSIVLTLAVGISRIYLGVHWPTDVLAGWMGGCICAILFWLIEWIWQEKIFGQIRGLLKQK